MPGGRQNGAGQSAYERVDEVDGVDGYDYFFMPWNKLFVEYLEAKEHIVWTKI